MILYNLTNMKRCFDSYVKENLEIIESLNINFEGLPFDDNLVNGWITPRILDSYDNRAYRDDEVKQSANIFYQVSIYTKKSSVTSSEEHYRVRDCVDRYFHIGKDIVYQQSGSTLAIARVRELINDFSLPETNELYQYVLAYEIDYNEI